MYKLVDNGKQYEIICKGARDMQGTLTTDKVYETLNASRFEIVKELF